MSLAAFTPEIRALCPLRSIWLRAQGLGSARIPDSRILLVSAGEI
jgi:hypothetical protein